MYSFIYINLFSLFTAIYCMSLGQIENVLTLYSPDTTEPYDYGTVATHYCNDGFYLIGETMQYCSDNSTGVIGDWNGSYPVCAGTSDSFHMACMHASCVKNCNHNPNTFKANVLNELPRIYMHACMYCQKLRTMCTPHNLCTPHIHALIQPMISTAIFCSSLPAPTNGSVVLSSDATSSFSYLTNATYSCEVGLGLTGGDPVRVCGGNFTAEWAGAAPACEGENYVH